MTRNSVKRLFTLSLILGMTILLIGQPTTVDAQTGHPYGSDPNALDNALYVYPSGSIDMQYNARIGACADDGFPFQYKGQKMTGCAIGWYRPTGNQDTEAWLSGRNGMTFFTNALPRMVVTAAGNVGIGNPDPTHALQVNGPSVYFTGDLYLDGGLQFPGGTKLSSDNNIMRFFTQGTQRMVLTPPGNLDLEYNMRIGPSADDGFGFDYSGKRMTGNALMWARDSAVGARAEMWLSGNNGMTFFTAQQPRMVVTTDGKVGIGNSNPTHALQVNGPSVYFTGDLNLDGALQFPANAKLSSDNGMMRFFTQSTQRMVLTPPGNLDLEYNMRIGPSADDGFGFDYSGKRMTGNALMWARDPAVGARAEMWLSGNNGMTFFTAQQPRMGIVADGTVGIYGDFGVDGHTTLNGLNTKGNVSINGTTTTKVLQITGGDLAEPFEIADADSIKPGMVVAIDPDNPGQMRLATAAYDRTVAGVVSGAGGIEPGVLMYKDGAGENTHPVALSGRVYVYADATSGPIVPGDLLTTAATPGHAMKVTDYERAQGAILGKAMSKLEEGTGLVLVLVTLQ